MTITIGFSFGQWLKQRRKTLDLTQERLAQRVGYSTATIKKIEGGDLVPSNDLAQLLAQTLAVPTAEQAAFIAFARSADATAPAMAFGPPPISAPTAWHVKLPSPAYSRLPAYPTMVIGRERDITAVCRLLRLQRVRLLTLTGPPGAGKTRLSLEVAAQLSADFADLACFVPLAATTDPALVSGAIAQALGVRELPHQPLLITLCEYLRDKELLLVLDNFEQVVLAAMVVTQLIAAAPRIKVLVTSREVLQLYGEHEYPVPALAVPDLKRLPPTEALALYASVELFVERAQAALPDFNITDTDAATIAGICAWLDGLPLAIEMAAARVRWSTPRTLLTQLSRRLELLTGGPRDLSPRQQTLRGAIDWSFDLLPPVEQQVFRRLGVFVGGFTDEAAAAVCNVSMQSMPELLQSLTNKSLLTHVGNMAKVTTGRASEPRFGMLEMMREYAGERAEACVETEALRRQHAACFVQLAELAEPELTGPDQESWLERLALEHDNFRAALTWCLDADERDDVELGMRLACVLFRFWRTRGFLFEGRAWLDRTLLAIRRWQLGVGEQVDGADYVADACVAKVLTGAGSLAWMQGDLSAALALHKQSLLLSRELEDTIGQANSLNYLGLVTSDLGDLTTARSWYEQSLVLYRGLDRRPGIANALNNLGNVASALHDYALARSQLSESLSLFRLLGDTSGIAIGANNLGLVAWHQGDTGAARVLLEESLELEQVIGNQAGLAYSLTNLGNLASNEGRFTEAREQLESSLAIKRELGDQRSIALTLSGLAYARRGIGDYAAAHALFQESLAIYWELDAKDGLATALEGVAGVLLVSSYGAANTPQVVGEYAVRLLSAAAMLRATTGVAVALPQSATYKDDLRAARDLLDTVTFERTWAEGQALALTDLVATALASR